MEEIALRYDKDFITAFVALILITWLFNVFATLLDLWSGIDKAKAKGEQIQSGGLRRTINKIGDYWKVQAFALMIDVFGSLFWGYPFASMIAGLGILLIEARSVIENLKEKRSAAAQLPSVITEIIKAKNNGDALAIINHLKAEIKQEEEKEKKGE